MTVKNTLLPFGAVVLNRVSIGGNETDRNPLDNSAVDSDIVVAPSHRAGKASVMPGLRRRGEVTYTIALSSQQQRRNRRRRRHRRHLPANTTLVAGSITGGGT